MVITGARAITTTGQQMINDILNIKGMTAIKLAQELGVSNSIIGLWAKGKNNPRPRMLQHIERAHQRYTASTQLLKPSVVRQLPVGAGLLNGPELAPAIELQLDPIAATQKQLAILQKQLQAIQNEYEDILTFDIERGITETINLIIGIKQAQLCTKYVNTILANLNNYLETRA